MNDEINSINMESRDERSLLALTTKNIGTLNWFIPDVDKMVRLSIIKNPLFNREIFEKIKNDKNGDYALFALTDTGYERLALNFADIRNKLAEQRQIILSYREYYEPKE